MYTPVSELKLLKEAPFHPYLLVARGERGRMRVAIDELVFIPHARLPKAGEAAMLKEGCLPPPEGMIGWWTGDGTLENQVWPNRGQGQGAWGYAKGKVGQAFAFQNFPNRPGIISFPTYPAIKMMQAVTVEGWVRLDAGPGKSIERFLTIEPETLVIRHEGNLAPGRLHFYMKINGELRHLYSQRLLKAGVFHHVAGTYDGETMKLYLDGMLMNSHSIKGTLAETGDGLTFSGGETLDGLLDEFTLYNRALGGDEIEAIYQAGAAGKCRP
jgi:hypothetical protein